MDSLDRLAVYFGLREDHAEGPRESWLLALLRWMPPMFLAFTLSESLGLDDSFPGYLLTLGLAVGLLLPWSLLLKHLARVPRGRRDT